MKVNSNFDSLVPNYLFADVARKTNEFAAAHPEQEVIKLGIGDVTLPLAPIVVAFMKKGCDDLRNKETFKGYPEYEGYDFVREAISGYYKRFGVTVQPDEIFVSDGAKSDCGNLPDIFSTDNTVLAERSSTPRQTKKTTSSPCPMKRSALTLSISARRTIRRARLTVRNSSGCGSITL